MCSPDIVKGPQSKHLRTNKCQDACIYVIPYFITFKFCIIINLLCKNSTPRSIVASSYPGDHDYIKLNFLYIPIYKIDP